MTSTKNPTIATFGEALWDCIPEGLFLGGAPFNVAYHAAQLGATALPITCVGDDFLGDQVLTRARHAEMNDRLIKRHDILETGVAIAQLDDQGNASYDIRLPAAWDEIELTDEERSTALDADALVFGSLATRSEQSRDCLESLLEQHEGLKICDINFRPPYDDHKRAIHFARLANIVKLNHEELYRIIAADARDFGLEEAIRECALMLGVDSIVVTLGDSGAAYFAQGELLRADPKPVEVADTIGAGDAFTAAVAVFTLSGQEPQIVLQNAIRLGSYVASHSGAQPSYDSADLEFAHS